MRVNLRYLPISFPTHLGRCCRVSDPLTGRSVIHVQTAVTTNPKNDTVMNECVSWVVERLGIKDVACDGWCRPMCLAVEGKRIDYYALRQDNSRVPIPRDQLHLTRGSGTQQFYLSGKFYGTVYAGDDEVHNRAQMKAFLQLQPRKADLKDEFEKVLLAAAERAPEFVDERCAAILGRWKKDSLFDEKLLDKITDGASENGIDLSKFPMVELVKRHGLSHWTLSMEIEKAGEELEKLMNKLKGVLPRELYEDLESLLREQKEPNRPKTPHLSAQQNGFFLELKENALAYGVNLAAYPLLESVMDKIEALATLVYKPHGFTHLESELRRLLLILVNCSSKKDACGRTLFDTIDVIHLARKMCTLNLTHDDHQEALARDIDERSFLNRLEQLGIHWGMAAGRLDAAFELAKEFYYRAIVRARHIAGFVRNWFDARGAQRDEVMLLLTTGFLSATIYNELDGEVAYYLVTPNLVEIQEDSSERFYQKLYADQRRYYVLEDDAADVLSQD